MMLIKNYLVGLLPLILIFCVVNQSSVCQEKQAIEIEGIIFARSLNVVNLLELQGVPNQQTFFVRVEKSSGETSSLRFIKIRNLYTSEKGKLPKSFFSSETRWRFILERTPACDEIIKDWKDEKEVLLLKPLNDLPANYNVPCFLLKEKSALPVSR
jgi:hypothetical protein